MNATVKQQLSRNPSGAGYQNPLKTYSVPATENPDGTINVPVQPVYLVDPTVEPIAMVQPNLLSGGLVVKTVPGGNVQGLVVNAVGIGATGYAVMAPGSARSKFVGCTIDIVCSGTVGNRIFNVKVLDNGANVRWIGQSSAAVTAGQTCGYDVAFGANGPVSTTVRRNIADTANVNVMVRENCIFYEAAPIGWTVIVDDTANIDNADAVTARAQWIDYA